MEIGLRQLSNILSISYANLGSIVRGLNMKTRKTKSNNHIELNDFINLIDNEVHAKIMNRSKIKVPRETLVRLLKERNDEGEERLEGIKTKKEKSVEIKKKIIETSEEISDLIKDSFYFNNTKKYVIHVGPTSSGKTYNAMEEIKKSTGKCTYLSPLRLLAWEVYEKLKGIGQGCNLLTGEDKMDNGSNITSSTIEMVNYNTEYDVVVMDESFMIGDPYRGKSWMKALLNLKSNTTHLISNDEALGLLISILEKTNRNYEVKRYDRKVPIYFAEEPSILNNTLPNKTLVVVFSRKNAIFTKLKLESEGVKTSILYGNLPPETKKSQIQKFIDGENSVCVTTDVIGMGLNVPADYVCFAEISKFDGKENRTLNTIEVRQIGGRAGRYLLSDEGIITSVNADNLEYLKAEYVKDFVVEKGYYALDDWMIGYLHGNTMAEKLTFFSKLDIIPVTLQDCIEKQSISVYLENLLYNESINVLDDMLIWKLINLPVSKNNSNYFSYIINKIVANEYVERPTFYVGEINTNDDLAYAEDKCKEIDLYITAIRSRFLGDYFINEELAILDHREHLINMIDVYLLDKKKMSVKLCKSCHSDIGFETPHSYCDACHFEKNFDKE